MSFLNTNFFLSNATAQRLFHNVAAPEPIIDFHSHLSAADILSDRKFNNLYEAWLEEDHYKWRAMRANGIAESYITGDASPFEKFKAWAETVPHTVRNPLYHWTHLELRRYFEIETLLNVNSASEIWKQTEAYFQRDSMSVRSLLKNFKVEVVCTTDDPANSLDQHQAINESDCPTKVYPTFRPDLAFRVDLPDRMNPWLDRLANIAETTISDFDGLLAALKIRHDEFHKIGGRLSDHDVPRCLGEKCSFETAQNIFAKARSGQAASDEEFLQFGSFLMVYLGKLDAEKGWTKQFHIGAFRNTNARAFDELGGDSGFDSVGDLPHGESLRSMLDQMEQENALPKTILYNLNPADNFLFGTMCGNFQRDIPGKMQLGSGWWFLDQKEGIEWQLNTLSNLGLLSRFVGMVTDSRSFLSFPRHEYFRRVLCNLIGKDIESGELPDEADLIDNLIRGICSTNAREFLRFA